MALPRLLIVQTGTVAEPLRSSHGDYPSWFETALRGHAEVGTLRAHEGQPLDDAAISRARPQGIVVTGSPLSVIDEAPWMLDLGDALVSLAGRGLPVFGVCFGHQLLCRVQGGRVVVNPRGREIGTVQVQLTQAGRKDPLFAWADGPQIAVQATHQDAVDPLPPSATLLAGNENTPVQAVRFSEAVAAVQFHPEIAPATMRALIASRAERLAKEGLDARALGEAVGESGAVRMLHAFAAQAARA